MSDGSYFVYLLKCADSTLYCGITTDIERRLKEHNSIKSDLGAKYTRTRRPVKMIYYRQYPNRSEASKEESRIKSLTRVEKLNLALHHRYQI